MSKVCESLGACPYAPQQTTAGCPAAELCPGYTEMSDIEYRTGTSFDQPLTATSSSVKNEFVKVYQMKPIK